MPCTSPATMGGNSRKRPAQGHLPSTTKKGRPSTKDMPSSAFAGYDERNVVNSASRGHGNRKGRKHLQKRVVSPTTWNTGSLVSASSDSAESLAPSTVYFKLILLHKVPTECNVSIHLDSHLGFLIMDTDNATFADVRAAIQDEFDPASFPGNTWKFALPSLGQISMKQEQLLGPVTSFIKKAFADRLGNGSADNPFQLSLLSA